MKSKKFLDNQIINKELLNGEDGPSKITNQIINDNNTNNDQQGYYSKNQTIIVKPCNININNYKNNNYY